MKTKQLFSLGIAALMFALAACTELTGPEQDVFSVEAIPQGMGRVNIRLDRPNARTTIPTLDGLHFTLDFTLQGNPDTKVEETLDTGRLTLTVALESGTWDLEVKGYSSEGRLTVRGTSSITVIAGINAHVAVYLTPDFSEGGTGTLDYSIIFPNTVSQAFLSLYSLDAQETYRETAVSGNTVKTLDNLPAGTYQAFIDLYDGTINKAAVWTGVVHIYDGSTTSLTRTFITDHFAACPPLVEASENTLAAKLKAVLDSPTGSYTITLNGTETDLASFTPNTLNVTGNKNIAITLRGNGNTVQLGSTGSLFTLGADAGSSLTLVMQGITLRGNSGNDTSLVQVNSRGTLEMKTGSLITGNTSSVNGGGVLVNGGKFTMSGGEVSGNTSTRTGGTCGGGVVVSQGTFTMNGGEVHGNKSNAYGGGVFAGTNAVSIMNGGAVSSNTGSKEGGGVHLNNATFTMNGGVIYGSEEGVGSKANKATSSGAAIYNSNGSVKLPELVTETAWETTIDKRTT